MKSIKKLFIKLVPAIFCLLVMSYSLTTYANINQYVRVSDGKKEIIINGRIDLDTAREIVEALNDRSYQLVLGNGEFALGAVSILIDYLAAKENVEVVVKILNEDIYSKDERLKIFLHVCQRNDALRGIVESVGRRYGMVTTLAMVEHIDALGENDFFKKFPGEEKVIKPLLGTYIVQNSILFDPVRIRESIAQQPSLNQNDDGMRWRGNDSMPIVQDILEPVLQPQQQPNLLTRIGGCLGGCSIM